MPRTPMNVALWLLLAMVGVSLLVTLDVSFSLGKVAGVVLGVLLFWAIVRCMHTPERLALGTVAFVLAGATLAIVGVFGVNGVGKVALVERLLKPYGLLIRGVPGAEFGFNPNPVAGCLVLFLPLQIALLRARAHRWLFPQTSRGSGTWLVIAQVVLLFLTAGAMLVMQSFGAWLGLAVAALGVWAWRSQVVRRITALSIAAVAVLVVAVGPTNVISSFGTDLEYRVQGHVELWSRAVAGICDYLLTGMEMNAFRKIMPVKYPTVLIPMDLRNRGVATDIPHAHNHLLQAALDLGIPGLVAYLSLWLIAATLLVSVYRGARERVHCVVAAGLGTGLTAHFVFGIGDAIALGAKVGILFWLSLAMTVALHNVAMAKTPPARS